MTDYIKIETIRIFEYVSYVVELMKKSKFSKASKKFKKLVDYINNCEVFDRNEKKIC